MTIKAVQGGRAGRGGEGPGGGGKWDSKDTTHAGS